MYELSASRFEANFDIIVDVKKQGFFRVFNFFVEIFDLKVGELSRTVTIVSLAGV